MSSGPPSLTAYPCATRRAMSASTSTTVAQVAKRRVEGTTVDTVR